MLTPIQLLHTHGIEMLQDHRTGLMSYRAPAGGLSGELRDLVAETALEYEERAAILEYDAGMTRKDAERLAAADATGCRDPRCPQEDLPKMFDLWQAGRKTRRSSPPPPILYPVVSVSAVDSLCAQIEQLKTAAGGDEASQSDETAREIHRLEAIVAALRKLQMA